MTTGQRLRKGAIGFTLIELMITVAIVGILAAIAYPSYKGYVIRTNRVDAQKTLMQMALSAEKYFTQRNTYGTNAELTAYIQNVESDVKASNIYAFVAASTGTTFRIVARPVSGKANANDGFMRLYHDGAKEWDKDNNGTIQASEQTWNQR